MAHMNDKQYAAWQKWLAADATMIVSGQNAHKVPSRENYAAWNKARILAWSAREVCLALEVPGFKEPNPYPEPIGD